MFTRRTATVTISAPEASIARRVSSKSLYLPVPTMSRERYSRPASTNGSFCWVMGASPATDELHDLDLIALADRPRAVLRRRQDVAVELDRDPSSAERELREKVGDGVALADRALFTVHDRDHRCIPVTPNHFLYNRGFVP